MSCFPGRLHEFKEISLDQFAGENLTSSVYFLSHCHSDHMVGLSSIEFSTVLRENGRVKLFCHTVTAGLLLGLEEYSHLESSIHSLECGTDYSIAVPSEQGSDQIAYYVTVSLIPAGHCPGSVMFLIRRHCTTVLYTGDFRLHVRAIHPRLRELFNGDRKLRYKIDSVYVDTTFCVPAAQFIPDRETCLSIIQDTITTWFNGDITAIAHVYSRSRYGYEFLMVQLSKFFRCQIHVTDAQYQRYRCVPSIQKFLTTDPNSTKIHFCQTPLSSSTGSRVRPAMPCLLDLKTAAKVLTLIPSVMYFTRLDVCAKDMVATESPKVVRVCYSSHSSYDEIIDFLTFLKPVNIYPNVKPNDTISLEDVRTNLSFLETRNTTPRTRDPYAKHMSDFMRRCKTRKCVILEHLKVLEAADDAKQMERPEKHRRKDSSYPNAKERLNLESTSEKEDTNQIDDRKSNVSMNVSMPKECSLERVNDIADVPDSLAILDHILGDKN